MNSSKAILVGFVAGFPFSIRQYLKKLFLWVSMDPGVFNPAEAPAVSIVFLENVIGPVFVFVKIVKE